MEGNLGSLIVSIGSDMTQLNAGLKAAETQVRNTSGKISEITNKIGLTVTAMGAAITGAFALMVKSSTDFAEEIYKTSERTGLAVETLSELKYVADQTESSFEAVANSLKFLNKNIYEATTGNIKINESFRVLGINLKDATGNALKADEVFLQIADRFKNIDDASAKTALAMQLFGRQGEGIIPVLNLGSEGIRQLSETAHKLGIVLTTENAKALDEFSDNTKSMQAAMGGLWLNITNLVLPSLEKLTKYITDIITSMRQWSEAHPELSKFLANFTLILGGVFLIVGPLILIFNQLVQALIGFKFAIPIILPLIKSLGVSLAALAANPVVLIAAVIALAAAWIFNWGKIRDIVGEVCKDIGKFVDQLTEKINYSLDWWKAKFNEWRTGFGTKGQVFKIDWHEEKTAAATQTAIPTGSKGDNTVLQETVTLVERHAQKIKELNDDYIAGKITAQEYYNSIIILHKDGLDIKQQEIDLLNQTIELERLATDNEYQKIYVLNEGIRSAQEYYRIKAELANQDLVDQQTTLTAATNLLQTIQSMHVTIWSGIFDFINMGIQKFSSGFSTAISSIILGTKKASEAFADFGEMMLQAIVEFIVQWGVQALIALTIGKLLQTFIGGIADTLAAQWLPAAFFASVATLGGAVGMGVGALATGAVTSMGLLGAMKGASGWTEGTGLAGAEGGTAIVDRPTLFLGGEAGPELVEFTPMNKLGQGGGNNITIEFNNPVVRSDEDIKTIAEKVSEIFNDEMDRIKHG